MSRGKPLNRVSPSQKKRDQDAEWERARIAALERDHYACQARRHGVLTPCGFGYHVHHIQPRGRGGNHDLENLITLCGLHHDWVHNGSPEEAKEKGLLK